MESQMLREIANDKLTPKKRDIESSSDFFERLQACHNHAISGHNAAHWPDSQTDERFQIQR